MKAATLLAFVLAAAPLAASANVITDWDDIAVKTIQPPGPVPPIGVDLTLPCIGASRNCNVQCGGLH